MNVFEHILFFIACGLAGYLGGSIWGKRHAIFLLNADHYSAGFKAGLGKAYAEKNLEIKMLQNRIGVMEEEAKAK